MMAKLRWVLGGLVLLVLAIQLVPVDRSNPAVESEVVAPQEVKAVMRRACYDCHSNQTVWPWYSRVAPVSWLVARDVHEGRRELNFSTWNRLSVEQQQKAMRKAWKEVASGEMPPGLYLPPHPEARLSAQDRTLLQNWSQTAGGRDTGDDD